MKACFSKAGLAVILLACVTGCSVTVPFSTAPDRSNMSRLAQLRGYLSSETEVTLPPDAIATVELVDMSVADAPAPVFTARRFATGGAKLPVAFTLDYDPARLLPNRRYMIVARIEDGAGRMLWRSLNPYPLPDFDRPVDLVLGPAG